MSEFRAGDIVRVKPYYERAKLLAAGPDVSLVEYPNGDHRTVMTHQIEPDSVLAAMHTTGTDDFVTIRHCHGEGAEVWETSGPSVPEQLRCLADELEAQNKTFRMAHYVYDSLEHDERLVIMVTNR